MAGEIGWAGKRPLQASRYSYRHCFATTGSCDVTQTPLNFAQKKVQCTSLEANDNFEKRNQWLIIRYLLFFSTSISVFHNRWYSDDFGCTVKTNKHQQQYNTKNRQNYFSGMLTYCLLGLTRWSYLTCEKFLLESHEIKRLAQHFLREYILILFFLAFLIHKTANQPLYQA